MILKSISTFARKLSSQRKSDVSEQKTTLIEQLKDLTKRWNDHEDIPRSQQLECAEIGKKLNTIGGMDLMTEAYYAAKGQNRSASPIQAFWLGIGDWQW